MQRKLFVALQFEVAHHFVEGYATGRARRFKSPVTLGTTEATKMLLINPYQVPAHGFLCRCAPALSDCEPGRPLAVEGRSVLLIVAAFCLVTAENRHTSGVAGKGIKFTRGSLDGRSGTLHRRKISAGARIQLRNSFAIAESIEDGL
jgi:hypothetical protein